VDSLQSITSMCSHHQVGYTPLIYAAWFGHDLIVGVLLKAGADVDVKSNVSVD